MSPPLSSNHGYKYKYVHVNTYAVCVSLYIHHKYTQYTHIYYVNKRFYRLTARWTKLLIMYIFTQKILIFREFLCQNKDTWNNMF